MGNGEKIERNQEIVDLIRNSPQVTYREAAARYGITDERIHQIVKRAGITRPPIAVSEARILEAAQMASAGFPMSYTAETVDVGLTRLRRLLVDRGLYRVWRQYSPWSKAEIKTVKRLYHRVPVRQIAEQLGRTRNEIIGRAKRLGLCKPTAHLRRQPHRTNTGEHATSA